MRLILAINYICLTKKSIMKYILLSTAFFISFLSFSQEKGKEKEKKSKLETKYLYKDASAETADYNIYVVDVVAAEGQAKFKIKIFNKTNDYLLVKPTEFVYTSDGKNILSTDRTYVVPPNEEESEVVDFKGNGMMVDNFSVEFKGIYKASAGGKPIAVPDFELPATTKEFTVENCQCVLKKADLETDKSVVKFDCMYTGDGVSIINPVKATMIMPNGVENANTKKHKPLILEKGKKDDFFMVYLEVKGAGDMQKKKTQIKWNDTFRESKVLPIGGAKINFEKEAGKK